MIRTSPMACPSCAVEVLPGVLLRRIALGVHEWIDVTVELARQPLPVLPDLPLGSDDAGRVLCLGRTVFGPMPHCFIQLDDPSAPTMATLRDDTHTHRVHVCRVVPDAWVMEDLHRAESARLAGERR